MWLKHRGTGLVSLTSRVHDMNQNPSAKAYRVAVSTSEIIDEMFDYDSQPMINDQKGAVCGRDRLDGTSESQKSTNLMDNLDHEDYGNEIFSIGDETFDEQWVKINNIYRANLHEEDEGFTTSDEDDRVTEDGIEDNVDGKQAEAKVTEDGVDISQINSQGVISDSNRLECGDQFLNTQYLIDDEDTGDQEGTNRGSTEEGENEV